MPVSPALTNGSWTTGSVSFTLGVVQGSDATLSTTGGLPIYQSRIDDNDYVSLWDAPMSWTTTTTRIERTAFGEPVMLTDGPNVNETIEIELNATLGAWDTAFITATFEVTDIPEPATMGLLAIGGVTILMRRRRHRA